MQAEGMTEARKLRAVSVGRLWDEAKGLQTLFEIEAPLPVFVAGEESFESATIAIGNILTLGHMEEDELLALFRSTSIYLTLSIYEPFGLAPLEAAQCGCAIVARNLPSLREVWGDSAFFFNSPEELGDQLRKLTSNPEMLRAAQRAAALRAKQFTGARMATGYIALYESLLSSDISTSSLREDFAIHAA